MKLLFAAIFTAAAFLESVAGSTDQSCHIGPRVTLVNSDGQGFSSCTDGTVQTIDPLNIPIDITSRALDGSSVSFEVTQEFADSLVSRFAVLFDTDAQHSTCDVRSDVVVDWVSQEYTAYCDATGTADVNIFLYLCGQDPIECEFCETPGVTSDYYEFTFRLVCADECEPSPPPTPEPSPPPTPGPTRQPSGSRGDPHFKTWTNEHYEYHGQCDLVLTKDPNFADGLGIDIQIRTKIVRFWSYIRSIAIRIGADILEIQGGNDPGAQYWINLQHMGPLTNIGGFPIVITKDNVNVHHCEYHIDLSSKYHGQYIVIKTYKEFVSVQVEGATALAFGNAVGLLGEFTSGATLARDKATIIDDFVEFGNEWQVLPSEDMLFYRTEKPQFPQKCINPEDSNGERRRHRRLDESNISEEQAEEYCSKIKEALDRKDCVYDILATQDLGLVGAY